MMSSIHVVLGLYGKDNMEKAKCDIVVEVLREVRYSLTSINPFNLKETDEAKIVCNYTFL